VALLLPSIQIDTSPSGFTWSVDREEGLNALVFTADGEGVEKFVPAFRNFFQVGSLRITLQPLVEFYGHRGEELSLGQLDRANGHDRRGTGRPEAA